MVAAVRTARQRNFGHGFGWEWRRQSLRRARIDDDIGGPMQFVYTRQHRRQRMPHAAPIARIGHSLEQLQQTIGCRRHVRQCAQQRVGVLDDGQDRR